MADNSLVDLHKYQWKFMKSITCQKEGCNIAVGRHAHFCRDHRPEQEVQDEIKQYGAYNPQVYFILGVGTEMVKIGRTVDMSSRLSMLQTGSPVKLLILTTIRGEAKEEIAIHKLLDKHRAHGEWFRMADEVIDVIEAAQKQGLYGINILLDKAGIDISQL